MCLYICVCVCIIYNVITHTHTKIELFNMLYLVGLLCHNISVSLTRGLVKVYSSCNTLQTNQELQY